jgi:DNA replication and repair protein RecF
MAISYFMTLDSLHLLFFKNYDEANLSFSPGINCFIGDNGSGKTNLLDAIHYLCLTKSAFAATDAQSIKEDGEFFVVKGRFSTTPPASPPTETIQVSLRQGQKKTLTHDKQPYERMADHIGRYPAVLISPYDTDLIRQGSEERRKYFDSLQAQLDHDFLELLITYNALLRQRNATLKQGSDRHGFDHDYLLALDEQLAPLGQQLHALRAAFLSDFLPIFQRHYQHLAEEQEQVTLSYKSQLTGHDFAGLLRANERRDQLLQRTHAGPHRDDFVFLMNERSVKNYASQGQQKSFAIALKLAQFEILAERLGQKPLLLLDDIFDRLDDKRIARLLELVANDTFGQVFLTDTNLARTDQALARVTTSILRFHVRGGTVETV